MMSIFAPIILTTAIVTTPNANGGETRDAVKAVAKATYKETNLDDQIKRLEKRYISKQMRVYGGYVSLVAKIVNDKRISVEWTF